MVVATSNPSLVGGVLELFAEKGSDVV